MIILSACDIKYEPFMKSLVRSVLKNSPYELVVKYLHAPTTEPLEYLASYRAYMFRENFSFKHSMLWLDADSLVRGDISQLDDWMKEYDTLAVHTPEMGGEGTMNNWLISTCGIANSEGGKLFLNLWIKELEKLREDPSWKNGIMTVQLAYVKALNLSKGLISVKDIGYKYSDKFMRPESPLWEGQGPRKQSKTWVEEELKYSGGVK